MNGRAKLCENAAAGAHTRAARHRRSRFRQAYSLQAHADRPRRHANSSASQQAAGFRTFQNLLRQQRPIPLYLYIDIILDRQRHHVLCRQVQVARAHQPFEAR